MPRVELRRNTSRPPGRSSRAASGIHRYGSTQIDAPYSETTRSAEASGRPVSAASVSTSGNSIPVSRMRRLAVSSCAGVGSTPTTLAPRRASHAEKYAVPHPSSTTSRPLTSPRRFSSDSGVSNTPHLISSCAQARAAEASVYSVFARVQFATFCRTYSGLSDKLIVREPERDLARRRLGRVGTVHEVVGHRARQVAANRARLGIGGIRRADRLAKRRDRALAFDDERQRRPGGDELDELTEKRLLIVFRVMGLPQLAIDVDQLAGAQRETAALDARQDLAGELPLDGIGLDQDEGALDRHGARV